jgi:hypothetical protein
MTSFKGYVLKGKQVVETNDLNEINKFYEENDLRRVNLTKLGNYKISTVFLTIDHGFGGKPMFFETGINLNGDWEIVERYSTYDEALNGHKKYVEEYRETAVQNLVKDGMDEKEARNTVMAEEVFA